MKRTGPVALRTGLSVKGRWVDRARAGRRLAGGERSGTGERGGQVVAATAQQARSAVEAAHVAFLSWSGLAPDERSAVLRRAYELVVRRAEELARILTLEHGKPVDEAKGEVLWGGSGWGCSAQEPAFTAAGR